MQCTLEVLFSHVLVLMPSQNLTSKKRNYYINFIRQVIKPGTLVTKLKSFT